MTRAAKGWKVVCPDGRVRHESFRTAEGAEAVAKAAAAECVGVERSAHGFPRPPCPGGLHLLRRTFFHGASPVAKHASS